MFRERYVFGIWFPPTETSWRGPLPLSSAVHRFSSSAPSGGAAAESRSQKLERIADAGGSVPWAGAGPGAEAAKPAEGKEKTAFDIKLEKFDTAAKIKVIKEVRTFTDLGLKEAKELVEKAPVVLKKGVTKEEAEAIAAKLKEVGATVALE
ncbi:hypothetical protein B296_00006749 [Ensete ventricosum]|uniref:Large ribosomal subunit protein bL12 C-terminal domain-containing protein n=1 Tax=Ensete ventricosum TaxID=4639 RepID=A0A427ABA7_ENSVE|nr:hypothetical protein B296_00006749 [Ensete ventricosum]